MKRDIKYVEVSFEELRRLRNLEDDYWNKLKELEETYKKGTYKVDRREYPNVRYVITRDEVIQDLQKAYDELASNYKDKLEEIKDLNKDNRTLSISCEFYKNAFVEIRNTISSFNI